MDEAVMMRGIGICGVSEAMSDEVRGREEDTATGLK